MPGSIISFLVGVLPFVAGESWVASEEKVIRFASQQFNNIIDDFDIKHAY